VAKKPVDPAKAKQAKQKKMLIVLGVVFVLAMAYAVNTMMGMNGGSSPPQAASTTAATTTPASTATTPPTTATAAPTLAGTGTTTPAAPTDSSALVAVVTPPADPGQLESFSHFESKDPFASEGPKASGSSSSGPSGSSGSGKSGSSGSSGGGSGSAPKTPPAPPAPPASAAVISVNGCEESVQAGSTFPSSNPLFLLNSVTSTSAQVSIAGGSYATGQATLSVSLNKPVTLVNTADGTRYTIVLMPQGTTVPTNSAACGASSSSSTSTSTTSTTTTPTTTTTTTGP